MQNGEKLSFYFIGLMSCNLALLVEQSGAKLHCKLQRTNKAHSGAGTFFRQGGAQNSKIVSTSGGLRPPDARLRF